MESVDFNSKNVISFIREYNKAQKEKTLSFIWDEKEFVTNYAYYVIQHLVNNKIVNGRFDTNKLFIRTV